MERERTRDLQGQSTSCGTLDWQCAGSFPVTFVRKNVWRLQILRIGKRLKG